MELEQLNDDAPLLSDHVSEARPRGQSNVSEDGRVRSASTASNTSEGGKKRRASIDRGPIMNPFPRATPQLTSVSDMESYVRSDEELGKMKNSQVRAFYRKQNDVINMLVSGTEVEAEVDNSGLSPQTRFIITFSFICNVLLFIVKVVAALSSGSLSVVASAIDSLLDLISGSFLFFVSRFINKKDPYNYPESKTRMEPLGIVAFAAIMGMASLQLTKEAVFALLHGFQGEPPEVDMNIFTICVIASTIVIKAGLYMYCRLMDNPPSIVDALRDDHRNDTITNAMAAVGAIVAGEFRMLWWFDAATALAFSVWILFSWVEQGREQVGLLVGKAAPADLIGRLAYLAGRHDDRIDRVDTVRAFRFGEKYLAEVDIILPENMPLREAHDIGEQLQIKIENEAEIQRAYVHLDYEWDHAPEH